MAYKQTKTIGGTAVSAILGVNPWSGPWDAWDRIVNNVQLPVNEAMARGTRLEGPIATVAESRLGLQLVEPIEGTIIIDDTFSATADRLGYSGGSLSALVEIKTAGTYGKLNPLPEHYRLQVQHYLWAYGLDVGVLVGLKTTNETYRILDTADDVAFAIRRGAAELVIHDIEKDPTYAERTIPILRAWFKRHVLGNTPPPADGSAACKDGLTRYFAERDGAVTDADTLTTLDSLVEKRALAKAAEEQAKAERQLIDNQIRAALGNSKRADGNGWRVSLSRQKGRVSLDQKALRDSEPETWAKYTKQGDDFEVLRVKSESG